MVDYFLELKAICDVIEGQILKFYGDDTYLMLSVLAILCLYISRKDLRYKILLPICVIMLIAWNPILYKYVFHRIIYWRLMWMMPTTVLISMTIVVMLKRQKNIWLKWGFLFLTIIFIASNDVNVFLNNDFHATQNWEKISSETIQVSDMMLEKDDTPKAIVAFRLTTQIRQYTPEISLLYGRNVKGGYIRWELHDILNISYSMESTTPDYNFILSNAVERNVNFIVVEEYKPIDIITLKSYGYKQIGNTGRYVVYYNEEI